MAGRIEYYKEDDVILTEGKFSKHMYIVQEGAVVIYMNYGQENEYVLGVCGKGKIFGEDGFLMGENSQYTAVAFTDCKIIWLDENMLEAFFVSNPNYAVSIMKKFAISNKMYRDSMRRIIMENEEAMDDKTYQEMINTIEKGIIKETLTAMDLRERAAAVSKEFMRSR